MKYLSDDVVVTNDRREHRVLWECKGGKRLYVKPALVHGRAYMIQVAFIVEHRKRVRK